jgi:hypothetical protein
MKKYPMDLPTKLAIMGGPEAGFNMGNLGEGPRPKKEWLEYIGPDGKTKEIVVCLAKAGECRCNSHFYSCGLRDEKSWATPYVMHTCPDRCWYKNIVHNDDNPDHPIEGVMTYFPRFNKYDRIFKRYFRVALKPELLDGLTPEGRSGDASLEKKRSGHFGPYNDGPDYNKMGY